MSWRIKMSWNTLCLYAFCFTAIRRLDGAAYIIAPNPIRMPNNGGLV